MPLTPVDIHNISFKKSTLGKRGYDEEEVDALLDAVSHEMIQLMEENDFLRDRVRRSGAADAREAPTGDIGQAALSAASDELDRTRHARDRAEDDAQTMWSRLSDARQSVTRQAPADPAEAGPDRVLAVARRTAEQHLQSAYQEAEELVLEARAESERITEEARLTAYEVAEGSRRRDTDAEAELQSRHTALLKEIAELTDFAAHYRAALGDHIVRQGQI
jgi:DivIVA domain-containing protein